MFARFGDRASVSGYALEAVTIFSNNGIVQGSGGMFRPRNNATRAETAVILNRIVARMQ